MATGQIFPNPVDATALAVLLNPAADQTINGPFALIFTGGGVLVAQGIAVNVAKITGTYTALSYDCTILCNGTLTLTLPTTGIRVGQVYRIKNIGVGVVTVSSAVNIDSATTQLLSTQYQSLDVEWDGTQWWLFGSVSVDDSTVDIKINGTLLGTVPEPVTFNADQVQINGTVVFD